MKPGERINLSQVVCSRYTTHERVIHHEECRTFHRYLFETSDKLRFVYSGVYLRIRVGDIVDIRCTIKRDERVSWGVIRIARVTVEHRGKRELLL